jgi:imidazolonepropionase-like amidohydrolase
MKACLAWVALVAAACGSSTAPTAVAPGTGTSTAPAPGASVLAARRYEVVFGGRAVGHGELVIDGDVRRTHFEYNDRGRGPSIDAELTLSKAGLPRTLSLRGVNYRKVAVSETLAVSGGALSWTAPADRGTAAEDSGFYLPAEDLLDGVAVLARALRQAPERRLAMLPAGEARIEDDTPHEVEVAGAKRRLSRVSITGLGFSPDSVWLDEDGELFGVVGRWFSVVPAGAAAAVPALLAIDEAAADARAATLAERLARKPPPAGLAIVNARVFDPASGQARAGQTIVIVGDRIAAVGPARAVKVPAGAERFDARGMTVLPGLWDMHTHLFGGMLHVAAGVTAVRDLGNDLDAVDAMKDRFDRGVEIGPRVVRSGLIDGPGPFAGPTKLLVETPEQATAAVGQLADRGYTGIKLYSSLPPALVPTFVAAARQRGLRVSGHIPMGMNARQAVEAGYDELHHINFLFLNFLAGPDDDTRTPVRYTLLRKATGVELASKEVTAFLDLLKAKKTVVDPTLTVFANLLTARAGEIEPGLRAVGGRLPAQEQRSRRGGSVATSPTEQAEYDAAFQHLLAMVKLLHDRGIPLVAGTDAVAGFSLHSELALYVKAGIPAAEVLTLATLGAARIAGQDRQLGSITVGKGADLYIVDGDPLADIAALRRGVRVISRGRVLVPDDVYAASGVRAP